MVRVANAMFRIQSMIQKTFSKQSKVLTPISKLLSYSAVMHLSGTVSSKKVSQKYGNGVIRTKTLISTLEKFSNTSPGSG